MINIGKLKIGKDYSPKIIAEIGINHNGSLSEAKKLAELAAESGADIIKSQFHIAEEEMSLAAKKVVPPHTKDSIYKIIDECSLSIDEEYEYKEFWYSQLHHMGNCIYIRDTNIYNEKNRAMKKDGKWMPVTVQCIYVQCCLYANVNTTLTVCVCVCRHVCMFVCNCVYDVCSYLFMHS